MTGALPRLLGLLEEPCGQAPDRVVVLAGYAMRDALSEHGLWSAVPAGHRAAVLTAMVHDPARADLAALRALVRHTARLCGARVYATGLERDFTDAVEILRRFENLPVGWREHVVRQLIGPLASAVGGAQQTVNILRSRDIPPKDTP